jgi:predicted amino acid dehydrogenase
VLRPARAARRGVIGAPVARTVAVVGTTGVVAHGVGRRHDRREDRRDRREDRRDRRW